MTARANAGHGRRALDGELVGISISDSEDLVRLGLVPAHLERALAEVVTLLAAADARIGYGGHIEPDGFTFKLFRSVAERYGSEDIASATPPCIHYLAAPIWRDMSAEAIYEHLWTFGGTTELVLVGMGGQAPSLRLERNGTSSLGRVRVTQRRPRGVVGNGRSEVVGPDQRAQQAQYAPQVWCSSHVWPTPPPWAPVGEPATEHGWVLDGTSALAELSRFIADYKEEILSRADVSDASYYSELRLFMAADEDARVVVGGKRGGYSGHFPGVAEESLYSLLAGNRLVALAGFGGCAADVAQTLQTGKPSPEQDGELGDSAVFAALANGAHAFVETLAESNLAEVYGETSALDSPRSMAIGTLKCLKDQRWRETTRAGAEHFRTAVLSAD